MKTSACHWYYAAQMANFQLYVRPSSVPPGVRAADVSVTKTGTFRLGAALFEALGSPACVQALTDPGEHLVALRAAPADAPGAMPVNPAKRTFGAKPLGELLGILPEGVPNHYDAVTETTPEGVLVVFSTNGHPYAPGAAQPTGAAPDTVPAPGGAAPPQATAPGQPAAPAAAGPSGARPADLSELSSTYTPAQLGGHRATHNYRHVGPDGTPRDGCPFCDTGQHWPIDSFSSTQGDLPAPATDIRAWANGPVGKKLKLKCKGNGRIPANVIAAYKTHHPQPPPAAADHRPRDAAYYADVRDWADELGIPNSTDEDGHVHDWVCTQYDKIQATRSQRP